MTPLKPTESRVLGDLELIKLSRAGNTLSEFVLQNKGITAVISSLVHYSRTFDSRCEVSSQKVPGSSIARILSSLSYIPGFVVSSYRRYVGVPKLMCRFPKTLRLSEKLHDEAASENSSAIKVALGVTHHDNAILWRPYKKDALLYIEAAAANKRGRKRNAAFNDRTFYSYAACLL